MDDKSRELLDDVTGEGSSDCCGAGVYELGDSYICMDCQEYCDMRQDEDEEYVPKAEFTKEQEQIIERLKNDDQ